MFVACAKWIGAMGDGGSIARIKEIGMRFDLGQCV